MADIFVDVLSGIKKRFKDMGDGTHAEVVSADGGGGATSDRELVVSTYRCKTAFTGASVGDTITATQVIDVSGDTPSTVSTIWRNQTTAADLAGAPSAANLELTGSQALTLAQLQTAGLATEASLGTDGATPPAIAGTGIRGWLRGIYEKLTGTVAVSAAALPLPTGAATAANQSTTNTALGGVADTPWAGSGNSNIIQALKGIYSKVAGTLSTKVLQVFDYSQNNSTPSNSSQISLANGGTWNGLLESAINQNYMTVCVVSDRAVTVTVQQYIDVGASVRAVPDTPFSVSAGQPYDFPLAVQGNYVRLAVSNSSGAQAALRVDTYYGPLPVEPATLTQAGNKRVAILEALPAGSNNIGSVNVANFPATQPVSGPLTDTQLRASDVPVVTPLPAAPITGQSKIATTGTSVQLAASVLKNGVVIKANPNNAQPLFVGDSGVSNINDGTGNGYRLDAGEAISFAVSNTSAIYVNGTAGDIFYFAGN